LHKPEIFPANFSGWFQKKHNFWREDWNQSTLVNIPLPDPLLQENVPPISASQRGLYWQVSGQISTDKSQKNPKTDTFLKNRDMHWCE